MDLARLLQVTPNPRKVAKASLKETRRPGMGRLGMVHLGQERKGGGNAAASKRSGTGAAGVRPPLGFAAARAKLARAKGESKKLYKVNNPMMGVFVRM